MRRILNGVTDGAFCPFPTSHSIYELGPAAAPPSPHFSPYLGPFFILSKPVRRVQPPPCGAVATRWRWPCRSVQSEEGDGGVLAAPSVLMHVWSLATHKSSLSTLLQPMPLSPSGVVHDMRSPWKAGPWGAWAATPRTHTHAHILLPCL